MVPARAGRGLGQRASARRSLERGDTEMLKPRTRQTFSGKGHRKKILGFAGHRVSVPIANSATVP